MITDIQAKVFVRRATAALSQGAPGQGQGQGQGQGVPGAMAGDRRAA